MDFSVLADRDCLVAFAAVVHAVRGEGMARRRDGQDRAATSG
jgi:hypothetical protein